MKKLLSCALIISMLSTMGAVCFAREDKVDVNKTQKVVLQANSTEELNEALEKIKAEIGNNDQLKKEIEALSESVKEEKSGTWSAIKSWFKRKFSFFGKVVNVVSDALVITLGGNLLILPWCLLGGYLAGWEDLASPVIITNLVSSGILVAGLSIKEVVMYAIEYFNN